MNLSSEHSQALTNEKINSPTLPLMLKKLLCAFGTYFDGQLHKFVLTEDQQLVLKQIPLVDKTYSLMIVARKFYHEEAKKYPIENKAELNKLLKLEFFNNHETKYHIWQQQENQSFVNIWHFNKELPKSYIRLPESLLFSFSTKLEQVVELDTKPPLFVGRQNSSVYSSIANDIINSTSRFSMSLGLSVDCGIKKIESKNMAETFAVGLRNTPLSVAKSFLDKPKSKNYSYIFQKIIIPIMFVFTSYLALSSTFIYIKSLYIQEQLQTQGAHINKALKQQQAFDEKNEHYTAIQLFLEDKNNSAVFWLVLKDVIEIAKFTNIRIIDGRYVLRGQTDKAIELLAKISKHESTKDAKFDSPTRAYRGEDLFVLSFLLADNNIHSVKDLSERHSQDESKHTSPSAEGIKVH